MCARFTLRKRKAREIADELEAELAPDDELRYRPRYNVAPTDLAWIVAGGADARVLRAATWSYVVGDGARRLINVRGESVGSGAGFREAVAERRCAVVTDGFYEWPAAKGQAPTLFRRADDGLVLLGGLFQRPRGGATPTRGSPCSRRARTRPSRACTIACPSSCPSPRSTAGSRAAPADAATLIASPAPDDALVGTLVSKHVNNVRNDDAACVVPAEAG